MAENSLWFAITRFSCVIVILKCSVDANCNWDLKKDLAKKEPLFLQPLEARRPKLYLPRDGNSFSLSRGEVLDVACAGSKNSLAGFALPVVRMKCVSGTNVTIFDAPYNVKDVQCTKEASPELKNTNRNCVGQGQILSVGFELPTGWIQLFEVCYNFDLSIPVYAKHTIHGGVMDSFYTGSDRPTFKMTGLPSKINLNTIYTRKYQKERFTSLLGETLSNEYVGGKKSFLSRGHLAPDADFHYRSWQYSTYTYANAAPQWQSINGGSWASLERTIRKAAKSLKEDIEVITGVDGVLVIRNENGTDVEMYLADNKVPVPKYYWKIACTQQNYCIGFVVSNDPRAPKSQHVCKDICTENNWSFEKERITCCSVQDMDKVFNIPDITVNGVFLNTKR